MGPDLLSAAMARRGITALADQAVASATNFLTGVIIGRSCTKEQFGLYMLGFSVWLFVMSFQTSIILTPYMVYSPRLKPDAQAQYTGSALIHQAGLSVVAIVALTVGGVVLSFGIGPPGLEPVVWTLAAAITFILLRECIRQISFANLQFKTALILDSGVSLLQIAGLLLLAYLGLLSASTAYCVIGLACGLVDVAWLLWMRKAFALRLTRAISDLAQSWAFGKWVLASGLLWVMSLELYPWILTASHGSASTGVWAACFGIAAIGNPLLLSLMSIFGPEMAHSYAKEGRTGLRRSVFKACAVSSVALIPFSLLLMIYGGTLVVLFYGSKYTGNGLVVFILALNLLAWVITFTLSKALLAMERADLDFAVNAVTLLVLLTFGLWLVKSFGPLGVAYGLLAGNTVSSAVRYFLFRRLVSGVSPQGSGLS